MSNVFLRNFNNNYVLKNRYNVLKENWGTILQYLNEIQEYTYFAICMTTLSGWLNLHFPWMPILYIVANKLFKFWNL